MELTIHTFISVLKINENPNPLSILIWGSDTTNSIFDIYTYIYATFQHFKSKNVLMDTITLCHKLCHTVHNSRNIGSEELVLVNNTQHSIFFRDDIFPRLLWPHPRCWIRMLESVQRSRHGVGGGSHQGRIQAHRRGLRLRQREGGQLKSSTTRYMSFLLRQVGLGIRNVITSGLVTRKDLFVTSKLWNTYHEPQHVEAACRKSLNDLGLEYLDLYLIHFPISLKFVPFEKRYPPEWLHDPESEDKRMEFEDVPVQDTWRAMEALVEKGLVRNIGVSNWNCQGLRDLFSYAKIKPTVLQVESKNMYTKHKYMSSYCRSRCTLTSSVSGWSPTPSPWGCMSPPSPPLVTASHTPPSATGTMWRSK